MKLSKLIHPETALGLRGNRFLMESYKTFLRDVQFEKGRGYSINNPAWEYLDDNQKEHLLMAWKFKRERPPVYYVPKDFTEALGRLDREVPVDLLPKRWFGYIAFADGAVFDDTEEVQGAYVYIGPGDETCLKHEDYGMTALWISYVCKDSLANTRVACELIKSPNGYMLTEFLSVCRLLTELQSAKVQVLMDAVETKDRPGLGAPKPILGKGSRELVYRTIVNTVLYINSIDADLIKAPSTNHLSHGQRKKRRDEGKPINECTVPITLVSWNYRRPVNYSVDSTWIDTYPKWQRCGEGFKSIKLIWVTPHERKYKKVPLEAT